MIFDKKIHFIAVFIKIKKDINNKYSQIRGGLMDKNFFKKCCLFSLSLLLTLIVGISIFFLFYNIKGIGASFSHLFFILRPILYGICLAYLLRPICGFFEKKAKKYLYKFDKNNKMDENKKNKISLIISIIIAFIILFSVLFILLKMILPQLISSIPLLIDTIFQEINKLLDYINQHQDNKICFYILEFLNKSNLNFDETHLVDTYITPHITTILTQIYDSLFSIILVLKDVFIGLIVSVYLLIYRKKLGAQAKLLLYTIFPRKIANKIYDEILFGDKTFNGFFVGKILDSLIIGLIAYACLSIIKMPFASLLSSIIGITNIIPFFGPFIGAVPCVIIVFVESPIKSIIFIIFIIILQQIDGNIIGPKILGSTTGVSSFWVLFSILIFGGLFGIIGMIVGIPLFAIIYDVIKKIVFKVLYKRKENDLIKNYNDKYHSEN